MCSSHVALCYRVQRPALWATAGDGVWRRAVHWQRRSAGYCGARPLPSARTQHNTDSAQQRPCIFAMPARQLAHNSAAGAPASALLCCCCITHHCNWCCPAELFNRVYHTWSVVAEHVYLVRPAVRTSMHTACLHLANVIAMFLHSRALMSGLLFNSLPPLSDGRCYDRRLSVKCLIHQAIASSVPDDLLPCSKTTAGWRHSNRT